MRTQWNSGDQLDVLVRYCGLGYFRGGFIFALFAQKAFMREIKNLAKIYQLN